MDKGISSSTDYKHKQYIYSTCRSDRCRPPSEMETSFIDFLRNTGIVDATLQILEEEAVRVFGMLHEEYIQKLMG